MAGITYRELMNIDEDLRFLSGHQQFYRQQQTVPKTVQEFVPQNQHELETSSVAKKDRSEADIEQAQKFAGVSMGIASLITESIISHPCIVIRRQCQVHHKSHRFHLTPFTLFPVVAKLQRRQGFGTLWKGAGSMFILRGLTLMTETIVSEFSPFPREINQFSSLKQMFQHLALKCITYTVLTPFYSASLVETVQSDIASEKPGVLDTLKEGLFRLTCWRKPRTNRLIPIWMLVGPSVLHGLLHYVISSVVQSLSNWFINLKIQREKERLGIEEKDHIGVTHQCFSDLTAIFIGNFVADIIVFPSETVLHRLFLQGTRTIIDNLDCGTSVMPVITRYEGPFDCIETILEEEGAAGLYKGFGALLLQYVLHAAILKGTQVILDEVMFTVRKARKR